MATAPVPHEAATLMDHLPILVVLIPFVAAPLTVIIGHRRLGIGQLEDPPGGHLRRVVELQRARQRLDSLEGRDGGKRQRRQEHPLELTGGHQRDGQHEDDETRERGQEP